MSDPLPLRPGDPERIGDYRLLSVLGEGGQGTVYLGEAPDGTRVAVKQLRTHLVGDQKARRYFAKELEAAQRVVAFCTVAILAADVDGDVPYIVSEYVDAVSLFEFVERNGPVSGPALDRLAVGTLNALTAIHQAGIIHRDFKPSNVLMAPDGPRVIDFGVAKALDATSSTTSGAVGTPAYMAPEQLTGAPLTPAVDMFAWAGTMTFAATGLAPFGRDSIGLVFNRILNSPPDLGSTLQGRLRTLVEECLSKDDTRRPTAQSATVRLLGGPADPTVPPPRSAAGLAGPVALAGLNRGAPLWAPPDSLSTGHSPAAPPTDPAFHSDPGTRLEAAPVPVRQAPPGHQQVPPPYPFSQQPPVQPPYQPHTPGTRRRWRTGGLAVGAAAAAVALIAVGTAVVLNNGGKPKPTPTSSTTPGPAAFDAATTRIVNPSSVRGGTITMAASNDFDSLDPGNTYYSYTWSLSRLYARTLVTYKPAPGAASRQLVPDLATSLGSPSGDMKTWTYHLRTGLKFEDGTPITSQDVKYAIARSSFGSDVLGLGPTTYFATLLAGAAGYKGPYKDKNLADLSGVETPDAYTLVFHLTKPMAEFDYLAALPSTAPVPAAKDTGKDYGNRPISSGPYKFENYTPHQSLSLVRNAAWDPATDPVRKALPDRIQITIGSNTSTVDSELLAGSADLDVTGSSLDSTSQSKATRANTDTPFTGMARFATISTKVPPLDNVHCRKAVEYAVDRSAQLTIYGGTTAGEVSTHVLPPVIAGSQPYAPYGSGRADLAGAKQELAACGKPSGFATNLATRSDRPKDIAQAEGLQAELAKAGITVAIKTYTPSDYYTKITGVPAKVHQDGLGILLYAWQADYPSGGGFLSALVDGRMITNTGNSNLSELNDSVVNNLLDQAAATSDGTQRDAVYAKADQTVLSDAAIVPLINAKAFLYRSPRLTNVYFSQAYGTYDYVSLGTS